MRRKYDILNKSGIQFFENEEYFIKRTSVTLCRYNWEILIFNLTQSVTAQTNNKINIFGKLDTKMLS